jgi:hypothetical protein
VERREGRQQARPAQLATFLYKRAEGAGSKISSHALHRGKFKKGGFSLLSLPATIWKEKNVHPPCVCMRDTHTRWSRYNNRGQWYRSMMTPILGILIIFHNRLLAPSERRAHTFHISRAESFLELRGTHTHRNEMPRAGQLKCSHA